MTIKLNNESLEFFKGAEMVYGDKDLASSYFPKLISEKLKLTPRFYEKEDTDKFERINNIYGYDYRFGNLFTFLPKLDEPYITDTGYKFVQLNAWQFLTRPAIKNVLSCHSLEPHNKMRGGNMGYIDSPFWGCFAMVKPGKAKAEYDSTRQAFFMDNHDLEDLGRCLLTFNAMLSWDCSTGRPCLFITKVYGDEDTFNHEIMSFLKYIGDTWGVIVTMSRYITKHQCSLLESKEVIGSYPRLTKRYMATIPCLSTLFGVERGELGYLSARAFYRYPDIQKPRYYSQDRDLLYEYQYGFTFYKPTDYDQVFPTFDKHYLSDIFSGCEKEQIFSQRTYAFVPKSPKFIVKRGRIADWVMHGDDVKARKKFLIPEYNIFSKYDDKHKEQVTKVGNGPFFGYDYQTNAIIAETLN